MATAREHDADQLLNERIDQALTELRVGERAWAESALTRHAERLSAVYRLTVSAGRTGGIGLALSTGTSPRSRPWMSTCHRLGRSEGHGRQAHLHVGVTS